MNRKVNAKAKDKSGYVSINASINIKTAALTQDEVTRKVDDVRNELFNAFRKLGFNAHEIKVN